MSKTYLIKSLLLLFALAPLTGCMMNPTDEYGVTFRNETFMPYGFTLNPEETIQFQVQHPRGGNLVYDRHNQHQFFVVQRNGP